MAQQVLEKMGPLKGKNAPETKFADTFACTYVISVFAASIAELCKLLYQLFFILISKMHWETMF
jgi:hypothetical protein